MAAPIAFTWSYGFTFMLGMIVGVAGIDYGHKLPHLFENRLCRAWMWVSHLEASFSIHLGLVVLVSNGHRSRWLALPLEPSLWDMGYRLLDFFTGETHLTELGEKL